MALGSDYDGFGKSDTYTFTIGNGANGSAVSAVDLGKQYASVHIECLDCSNIASTTTLSANYTTEDGGTLVALKKMDTFEAWASENLPTSGTMGGYLNHALGVREIQLVLSNNASGGSVVFRITGYDPVIKNSG